MVSLKFFNMFKISLRWAWMPRHYCDRSLNLLRTYCTLLELRSNELRSNELRSTTCLIVRCDSGFKLDPPFYHSLEQWILPVEVKDSYGIEIILNPRYVYTISYIRLQNRLCSYIFNFPPPLPPPSPPPPFPTPPRYHHYYSCFITNKVKNMRQIILSVWYTIM